MNATGTTPAAQARLVPWPRRPDIVQLVLTDHHMVPTGDDITRWLGEAARLGAATARTNALFPPAAAVFARNGFSPIDTLTLLRRDLRRGDHPRRPNGATQRMRNADLPLAAEIDRRAFGDEWANDTRSLGEIRNATPRHRDRVVRRDGRLVAFALSGRAGGTGYIQRLAVDPDHRRQGHARVLVDDALGWMTRRSVSEVLVNTAADNEAALALYRSAGFSRRDEPLVIMERAVPAPIP